MPSTRRIRNVEPSPNMHGVPARDKGPMARARHYVEGIVADNTYFEYTPYHFAPAFFFARDPEDREKQDFIQLLVDRYLVSIPS